MKVLNLKFVVFVLVVAALLAACGGAAAPAAGTPEPTLPAVTSDAALVAEGRIVPREEVELAFTVNGQVAEVLVSEGDSVKVGDVLARLGDREELEAKVANAEKALLDAEQALQTLQDDAPGELAETLERIATANKAVKDAQYQLDVFTIPSNHEQYTAIEAINVFKEKRDEAWALYKPYRDKDNCNDTCDAYKERWEDTQGDYNSAVRRLNLETDMSKAESDLELALRDFNALADGPKAEDVTAAESRIRAAQADLMAAQAALQDLDLVATIDGSVVDLDLIMGENVTAQTTVISLADFSQMYVETDDLTEIEVVDVQSGQKVSVVADALPDDTFTGTVDRIKDKYEEKQGDVTYTTRILLDQADPRLRWGMTVVVTFE